jgi:hypothetical protein
MLESFSPVAVERWGSLVSLWPADKLPIGVSPDCRNVRFTPSSVRTREGLTEVFATGTNLRLTGLGGYTQTSGTQMPLVFDANGDLYIESPVGSGRLAPVTSALVVPPKNCNMEMTSVYGRAWFAFGNGISGTGQPASFDGTNLDPVAIAAPAGSANAADATAAGNVCAGTRYGVVMFKTRSGYISAPQAPFVWTATGGKSVEVTNLPIGPPQVIARVVAFTVAGGSSAGPYFAIGEAQTINGVTETSTIVEDNTTTYGIFNFDDAFLAASTDYTNCFRKIIPQPQASVMFSPATRRLIWWGEPGNPSLLRVSEVDDAESYFGDTGFIEVAENDGQRITGVFEYLGQLYAAKERALYSLAPGAGDPATWGVFEQSRLIGACGPRAFAVGNEFVICVNRAGAYLFTGGEPTCISYEIDTWWKRINWQHAESVWVHIDEETKEIRIGVPLDQATVPNVVLKLAYEEGFDPPVIFSRFTGTEKAFPGRKWSVDDVPAACARRIERTITGLPGPPGAPVTPRMGVDNSIGTSQLLFASSNADGSVSMADPDAASDNGHPFQSWYQTAFLNVNESSLGASVGVQQLGGISCAASGRGRLDIHAVPNQPGRAMAMLRSVDLQPDVPADIVCQCRVNGERIALRFSNGGEAGAAFDIRRTVAWMRTAWQARAASER